MPQEVWFALSREHFQSDAMLPSSLAASAGWRRMLFFFLSSITEFKDPRPERKPAAKRKAPARPAPKRGAPKPKPRGRRAPARDPRFIDDDNANANANEEYSTGRSFSSEDGEGSDGENEASEDGDGEGGEAEAEAEADAEPAVVPRVADLVTEVLVSDNKSVCGLRFMAMLDGGDIIATMAARCARSARNALPTRNRPRDDYALRSIATVAEELTRLMRVPPQATHEQTILHCLSRAHCLGSIPGVCAVQTSADRYTNLGAGRATRAIQANEVPNVALAWRPPAIDWNPELNMDGTVNKSDVLTAFLTDTFNDLPPIAGVRVAPNLGPQVELIDSQEVMLQEYSSVAYLLHINTGYRERLNLNMLDYGSDQYAEAVRMFEGVAFPKFFAEFRQHAERPREEMGRKYNRVYRAVYSALKQFGNDPLPNFKRIAPNTSRFADFFINTISTVTLYESITRGPSVRVLMMYLISGLSATDIMRDMALNMLIRGAAANGKNFCMEIWKNLALPDSSEWISHLTRMYMSVQQDFDGRVWLIPEAGGMWTGVGAERVDPQLIDQIKDMLTSGRIYVRACLLDDKTGERKDVELVLPRVLTLLLACNDPRAASNKPLETRYHLIDDEGGEEFADDRSKRAVQSMGEAKYAGYRIFRDEFRKLHAMVAHVNLMIATGTIDPPDCSLGKAALHYIHAHSKETIIKLRDGKFLLRMMRTLAVVHAVLSAENTHTRPYTDPTLIAEIQRHMVVTDEIVTFVLTLTEHSYTNYPKEALAALRRYMHFDPRLASPQAAAMSPEELAAFAAADAEDGIDVAPAPAPAAPDAPPATNAQYRIEHGPTGAPYVDRRYLSVPLGPSFDNFADMIAAQMYPKSERRQHRVKTGMHRLRDMMVQTYMGASSPTMPNPPRLLEPDTIRTMETTDRGRVLNVALDALVERTQESQLAMMMVKFFGTAEATPHDGLLGVFHFFERKWHPVLAMTHFRPAEGVTIDSATNDLDEPCLQRLAGIMTEAPRVSLDFMKSSCDPNWLAYVRHALMTGADVTKITLPYDVPCDSAYASYPADFVGERADAYAARATTRTNAFLTGFVARAQHHQ